MLNNHKYICLINNNFIEDKIPFVQCMNSIQNDTSSKIFDVELFENLVRLATDFYHLFQTFERRPLKSFSQWSQNHRAINQLKVVWNRFIS